MSPPLPLLRWLTAAGLVAGALSPVLAGCPGTLDDPSRFQITTCDPLTMTCGSTTSTQPNIVTTGEVQEAVFKTKCFQCHGPGAPLGNLDLSGAPDVLEGRIVEAVSTTPTCLGRKLVVPGQPDRSLMYVKLVSTPTCGSIMPLGAQEDSPDAPVVRQWIIDMGTP